MTWTSEKPTTLGWYWWKGRCRDDEYYMKVLYVDDRMMFGSPPVSIHAIGGEWSGPIEPPQEKR